jgi:AmiR/NasT family two-component response regulator
VLDVAAAGVLLTDQRGALRVLAASTEATLRLALPLADVATIGILHARAIRHREILTEQLQTALNSRVAIEQAKGVIAERRGLDMDQTFTLLRGAARNTNRKLSELAHAIVEGTETL